MVCSGHDHDMAWQIIDLKKQRAYYTLYLACFVDISALLAHNIKLVKEQYTVATPHLLKKSGKTNCRFTEIAGNHRLVADDEQGYHELGGKSLRKGGLAISWGASEKDPVPAFKIMGSQKISTIMLLNKFADGSTDHIR